MAGVRDVICPSDTSECFLDEQPDADGLMTGQTDYLVPLSSPKHKQIQKKKSYKPRKIVGKGLKSIRKRPKVSKKVSKIRRVITHKYIKRRKPIKIRRNK